MSPAAVGVAATLRVLRRALAPLDQVVTTARDIGTRDPHRRLAVPEGKNELRELALARVDLHVETV